VALTTDGRLLKRHFKHPIRAVDILVALRHFRHHLPGPLIIVWDRLSAHRDRRVQQWIAADPELYCEWLPPYAPELNPEEYCNNAVKGRVRNATPNDNVQFRRLIDRAYAAIRRRPDLLQSFFELAGLDRVTLSR
jgi:transposase